MFKNLFVSFGATALLQALNMVSGILTARLLGPTGKGELTAVIIWVSFLAYGGNLGMPESIIYFTGRDRKNIPRLFSNSLVLAFLQSIILISIGLLIIPHLLNGYGQKIVQTALIYLIYIPLNLLILYQVTLLQGDMKMIRYNSLRVIVQLSFVVGILWLWNSDLVTVWNFAGVSLIANLITLIATFIMILKLGMVRWKVDFKFLVHTLSYGIKSHIGNLMSMLNFRLDQMLISVLLSPTVLGLYVVAVSISSVVNLIAISLGIVSFPNLTRIHDRDKKIVALTRFIRLILYLVFPAAATVFLIIPWVVRFFFGEPFMGSVPTARVLTVASVFLGLNLIFSTGVKAFGKPIISTYAQIVGLGMTIVFLVLLLPRFQIMGAAIASLIAYFASTCYFVWYLRKNLSVSLVQMFVPQYQDIKRLSFIFQTKREF